MIYNFFIEDGEKALDILIKNKVNLIITDIRMENMDGMNAYSVGAEPVITYYNYPDTSFTTFILEDNIIYYRTLMV